MEKLQIPPCYKYIASNIKTPEERLVFARNFYIKMKDIGCSHDEICVFYLSLKFPSSCGKIFSINGVDIPQNDFFEHVTSDGSLAFSGKCQQYYKEVMNPPGNNNLCNICPHARAFKNSEFETECSIFRYIAESNGNYSQFVTLDYNNVFKYSVDIAAELDSSFPAIVPIFDVAFRVLKTQLVDFYAIGDVRGRLESLVGKLTAVAAKNKAVKDIQMNNHRALPVAWSDVVDSIVLREVPTFDFVSDYVASLGGGKKKKKKEKVVETPPLFEYISNANSSEPMDVPASDSMPDESEASDSVTENAEDDYIPAPDFMEPSYDNIDGYDEDYGPSVEIDDADIPESAYSEPTTEPSDDELPFENASNANEPFVDDGWYVPDDIVYDEDGVPVEYRGNAPAEQEDEETADDSTSDSVWASNVSEPTPAASVEKNGPAPQQPNNSAKKKNSEHEKRPVEKQNEVKEVKDKPSQTRYSIPPINEDSLIFNISVNKRILKTYAYPYDELESDIFVSVQKSKRLPIEVVYDENRVSYVILFIRSLGKFAYCPVDNGIPNTLIAIMQKKSVVKICYQPYFLYSIFRIHGINITGVYSMCSVDTILHPNAVLCNYSDFFRMFDVSMKEMARADTGFAEFDTLLENMQKYILIQAMQSREHYEKDALEKGYSKDEVLGTSFLRAINLKSDDYLFELEPNGNIVYNTKFEPAAKADGFFVTYSLACDDLNNTSVSELFLDALCNLSEKGRLRKFNIQLVTMINNTMVLFIGENEYELITTMLQKYFNEYSSNRFKRHVKFDLSVSHERIYCNTEKGAKRPQLPRNYEQAMDLLITTNDTVTVDEKHVVRRDKVKRKKQTKKFNPTD